MVAMPDVITSSILTDAYTEYQATRHWRQVREAIQKENPHTGDTESLNVS